MSSDVRHGDTLQLLPTLAEATVDAVATDPPYGLGFMGHAWDQPGAHAATRSNGTQNGGQWNRPGRTGPADRGSVVVGSYDLSTSSNRRYQAWCEAWAAECLRVLKPGGHLLAFGGTRTYHRLAAGIEDAGFEIRDTLAWMYGSGFPKSLDVSKAIDRAAAAEREVIGRYTSPQFAERGYDYDPTGADERHRDTRQVTGFAESGGPGWDRPVTAAATPEAERWDGWGTALKPAYEPIVLARKPLSGTVAANVVEHGTGALNIDACRIDSAGRPYRESLGDRPSLGRYGEGLHGSRSAGSTDLGRWPANVALDEDAAAQLDTQIGELTSGANPTSRSSDKFRDIYGEFSGQRECVPARGADRGGPSRFLYVAKASRVERNAGLDGPNAHPTVKPVALMRWLVRLVTPPGGVVLDPFTGSGTTGVACALEGFRFLGVEREADYVEIARRRIAWAAVHPADFHTDDRIDDPHTSEPGLAGIQGSLFGAAT